MTSRLLIDTHIHPLSKHHVSSPAAIYHYINSSPFFQSFSRMTSTKWLPLSWEETRRSGRVFTTTSMGKSHMKGSAFAEGMERRHDDGLP